MMEWSLAGKPERVGPVEVEDIRKDLLSDFSALPTQDSQSENLQVFLRIRPFTSAESDSEETQDCVTMEGPDTVILKAPRINKSLPQTGQRFTFTQVFGPDSSQRAVFEGSVRSLVRDVLDGGNCLVFTYGVTNAGKTFTFLGPDHDLGLLPRSLAVIFNSIEGKLYSRCDLKPQRCRDYTRLTPDQQSLESVSKRTLMKMFKETDKTLTSGKSTFLDGSNVTDSSLSSSSEDSFVLEVEDTVKFSVWVSFCEIYNDNIHDLLEHVPNGHQKRTVLRLSQDVKGNSFIKDLRWVQVSSSEEAYRIMKIGKKNQSISATRLNQLSSRSHSIFSIRLMKIDDVGVPRVLAISELALCDLAGSERCSRTQNTGDRLKEAGNINNSLLTLGKCISAMRTNQHSKFQQHIPFRESKLTHFLQFFFCGSGSGKVSMVVNINQSSSSFDETLNVLKFSALAQKVVVLNTRPAPMDAAPQRSAMELSLIIDEAETRRFRGRKSSMVWERSLEDVLETEDWDNELDEEEQEEEEEEEQTEMEGTVLEVTVDETTMEGTQSDRAAALRLVLEAQIREEVSTEFMELFNKMEKDYSERLEKEREILEERAEKRVEILKNLVHRTVDLSALERQDPEQGAVLESIISAQDLEKIREEQDNAREVQTLRVQRQETLEQLEAARQSVEEHVQQLSELTELCQQKDDIINKLTSTLDQTVEDATRERSVVESVRTELMQLQQNCSCQRRRGVEEGEEMKEQGKEERKRPRGSSDEETGPSKKRALLEEEIWRLHEEIDQKEHLICELRQHNEEEETRLNQTITRLQEDLQQREEEETRLNQTITRLQEDLQQREEEETRLNQTITRLQEDLQQREEEETRLNQTITRLQEDLQQREEEETRLNQTITRLQEDLQQREEEETRLNQTITRLQEDLQQREEELEHGTRRQMELETKVQELSEETGCSSCESVFLSLESEQKETSRLNKENKALVNGMFQLQNQVTDLKKQLSSQSNRSDSLSEELTCTKTRLNSLQSQSEEREHTIHELRGEVERLRQDAKEENMFHEAMDRLKEESESALNKSAEKTQQIQELQEKLQHSERLCTELREELTKQRAAFACLEAELKEHCASFKQRLETIEEERERTDQRNRDLLEMVSLREQTVAEAHSQMETLRKELERLREQLQDPSEEEEKERQPQHQQQNLEENHHQKLQEEEVTEERKVTVVEELREELQKLQQRRNNRARRQEQSQEQENTEEENQTDENEREEKRREERRMEAVKREVQRFRELQNHHNVQRSSPEKMMELRRTPRTTGKKRKSCEVQGLVFSENKRNRGRAHLSKQASSSSLKERPLNKLGDLLHKSPSIISSTAKGLMGLMVDSKSTGSKLKRGRRKLYRTHSNSPMADSPVTACEGLLEEKESDHFTIKRQLRSKRK
ncbi:kinesin-like protein KIF20B isoform X2 [Periophthalmus magnuspinnatus]|uniref:kinesin-like protein KIF20B isoform X2 n=1 Tax=Periophthalmus magnuspinnatus TaxID=409849 RepID=UPI002437273E|nr:kinesin-like protein KIF20B isoform X2 [Periophthalmus magnuspinnatus]